NMSNDSNAVNVSNASTISPYGTWPSPISASMVATQGLRLGAVMLDGDDIYWLEGRPHEGGRTVLVRRAADGRIRDVTPPPSIVPSPRPESSWRRDTTSIRLHA